jgi:hypothetical protein
MFVPFHPIIASPIPIIVQATIVEIFCQSAAFVGLRKGTLSVWESEAQTGSPNLLRGFGSRYTSALNSRPALNLYARPPTSTVPPKRFGLGVPERCRGRLGNRYRVGPKTGLGGDGRCGGEWSCLVLCYPSCGADGGDGSMPGRLQFGLPVLNGIAGTCFIRKRRRKNSAGRARHERTAQSTVCREMGVYWMLEVQRSMMDVHPTRMRWNSNAVTLECVLMRTLCFA